MVVPDLLLASDLGVGTYRIECRIIYSGYTNLEGDLANNIWPISGRRYFRVITPTDILVDSMTSPVSANIYRYPYIPVFRITNKGGVGINGLPSNLTVTHIRPGLEDTVVHTENKLIENIHITDVTLFRFDNIFFPMEAGLYRFVFKIYFGDDSVVYSVDRRFSEGMSGTYTVGFGGALPNFPTIHSALYALFQRGVSGDVVFELTQKTYELDAPLDFRSRIMGVGPDKTITFRPSADLMTDQDPISIYVNNPDGVAMLFGQALITGNYVAAVNQVSNTVLRRYLANSEGYITFDGGPRKNISIRVFNEAEHNDKGFSSPVYLDAGARNITIKNCRIEAVSPYIGSAVDIPTISYNRESEQFSYEDNMTVVGMNTKAYSSGVTIRNQSIKDVVISNIRFSADLLNAENNVIEGNYIRGFGYGILSLGSGARYSNNEIFPVYNRNNRFENNYITNIYKSGIFLGFEENPIIRNNRIYNVTGANGVSMSTAGIQLGLEVPTEYNLSAIGIKNLSYYNTNVTIEKNEIDRISSDVDAYGVVIMEPEFELQTINGTNFKFPVVDTSAYILTNNIIYNISSTERENLANRYGIAVSPSADINDFDAEKHKIHRVVIANNTIKMDDMILGGGTIETEDFNGLAGILVFDVNQIELVNNAIYMRVDRNTEYDYVAAMAIRSMNPNKQTRNFVMNNNAYYLDRTGSFANPALSVVRFFELDKYGRLLDDGGFAAEYGGGNDAGQIGLRNWQNWTGTEKHSVIYNFEKDMIDVSQHFIPGAVIYNKTRMSNEMHKTVSGLNRGARLNYVTTDIDGVNRTELGKTFDIGAIEFDSKRLFSDIEVRNIHAPAAYRNVNTLFNDAEYVMLRKMQGNYASVPVRGYF
jgi:hypothetical protein